MIFTSFGLGSNEPFFKVAYAHLVATVPQMLSSQMAKIRENQSKQLRCH